MLFILDATVGLGFAILLLVIQGFYSAFQLSSSIVNCIVPLEKRWYVVQDIDASESFCFIINHPTMMVRIDENKIHTKRGVIHPYEVMVGDRIHHSQLGFYGCMRTYHGSI